MADLPKPRIAIIDTPVPNAFATGRSPEARGGRASRPASGTGSSRHEVEGVLAHELSHIANRDVLIMTVASFFAMLAAMLTRFGMYAGMFGGGNRDNDNGPPVWLIVMLVSIVVYALSYVLIRTISRYREYAADRGAAIITGAPEHLMSALQKISSQMTLIPQQDLREVEGMNAFFIIPAKAKSVAAELFATHPPLEKRLAALAEIARRDGPPGRLAAASGWASATSSSGARSSPSRARTGSSRCRRRGHARDRARAEAGRRRRGHLQAALVGRLRPRRRRHRGAAPRGGRVGRLEDRAQDRHLRLRVGDRPRPATSRISSRPSTSSPRS